MHWWVNEILSAFYCFNCANVAVTVFMRNEFSCTSVLFRGIHGLCSFDWLFDKCIVCKLCEFVCPAYAIVIRSSILFIQSRSIVNYYLDFFRCIFCGLCVEVCPVEAIDEFAFCDWNVESFDTYWGDCILLSFNAMLFYTYM